MADSTVRDLSKMKVVDLREELKARGLSYVGNKAKLMARLQSAMLQVDHGDFNLDSDEMDSDIVLGLEDDDDKDQADSILDEKTVELALQDTPLPGESKPTRVLKRKLTNTDTDSAKETQKNEIEDKEGAKKIVLNRATSIVTVSHIKSEEHSDKTVQDSKPAAESKVKISANIDAKTRLELRAKRFGLPIKGTDDERKEARKMRFGQVDTSTKNTSSTISTVAHSENLEKMKKRAERFGQNVSRFMTDVENQERLQKRKEKFATLT